MSIVTPSPEVFFCSSHGLMIRNHDFWHASFVTGLTTLCLIKVSQRLIIFTQLCYNEKKSQRLIIFFKCIKGGMTMTHQPVLTETEILKAIQAQPSLVQIKGDRQAVQLSYKNLCVNFPVREQIYTRWVCALADAEVVTTDPTFDVSSSIIHALAFAAETRKPSSFDIKFQ